MLYLPFRGHLIEWRGTIDDVTEELAIEDGNCYVLSERDPPGIVQPHNYGTSRWRREPGVQEVRQVWLIREGEEVYGDDLTGERIDGHGAVLFLYIDHEQMLRDVAEGYEPYRLLLELRGGGPKAARPLARQVLAGQGDRLQSLI